MTILVVLLAVLVVVATALPTWDTHRWWVRMWDFPRVQISVAALVVGGLALLLPPPWRWIVLAAMAASLGVHLRRIWPFTPLARKELRLVPPREDGHDVTCLAINVLMENDRHDLVTAHIREVDPDVLFLMETDQTWVDALEPVLARYPTVLRLPQDDCYGMVLATRLRTSGAEMVHLTRDEKPTAFADLLTPSGRLFHFVGLHPQPPVPGVDTQERDAQILTAARFARKTDVPVVVMGDFNDAAWSPTARLFKHYGRYIDPRLGRGLYASFHAKNVLIRCAIDQLYVTEEVAVVSFGLGPRVGSDHFPIRARLRIDPEEGRRNCRTPPPLSDEEREELDARVAEWRAALKPKATVLETADDA